MLPDQEIQTLYDELTALKTKVTASAAKALAQYENVRKKLFSLSSATTEGVTFWHAEHVMRYANAVEALLNSLDHLPFRPTKAQNEALELLKAGGHLIHHVRGSIAKTKYIIVVPNGGTIKLNQKVGDALRFSGLLEIDHVQELTKYSSNQTYKLCS